MLESFSAAPLEQWLPVSQSFHGTSNPPDNKRSSREVERADRDWSDRLKAKTGPAGWIFGMWGGEALRPAWSGWPTQDGLVRPGCAENL